MLLEGNLIGLQHLGIPVSNLEKSKAFYANLEFKEVMNTDISEGEETVNVVMLQCDDFTIELDHLPVWENGVKFLTLRGPDGEKIEYNQRL